MTCRIGQKRFWNTVFSQTRMKTNLRTIWTAFVSFGLPYRCYAFTSLVTVYAIMCSCLSQSALCSGTRHHHLATFNHIASALHESRTCLFFLKFNLIKQDFILLFFFMCLQILWEGQKAVLTIAEFFYIFYSKFQLVSIFPFAVNFVLKMDFFAVTWAANV